MFLYNLCLSAAFSIVQDTVNNMLNILNDSNNPILTINNADTSKTVSINNDLSAINILNASNSSTIMSIVLLIQLLNMQFNQSNELVIPIQFNNKKLYIKGFTNISIKNIENDRITVVINNRDIIIHVKNDSKLYYNNGNISFTDIGTLYTVTLSNISNTSFFINNNKYNITPDDDLIINVGKKYKILSNIPMVGIKRDKNLILFNNVFENFILQNIDSSTGIDIIEKNGVYTADIGGYQIKMETNKSARCEDSLNYCPNNTTISNFDAITNRIIKYTGAFTTTLSIKKLDGQIINIHISPGDTIFLNKPKLFFSGEYDGVCVNPANTKNIVFPEEGVTFEGIINTTDVNFNITKNTNNKLMVNNIELTGTIYTNRNKSLNAFFVFIDKVTNSEIDIPPGVMIPNNSSTIYINGKTINYIYTVDPITITIVYDRINNKFFLKTQYNKNLEINTDITINYTSGKIADIFNKDLASVNTLYGNLDFYVYYYESPTVLNVYSSKILNGLKINRFTQSISIYLEDRIKIVKNSSTFYFDYYTTNYPYIISDNITKTQLDQLNCFDYTTLSTMNFKLYNVLFIYRDQTNLVIPISNLTLWYLFSNNNLYKIFTYNYFSYDYSLNEITTTIGSQNYQYTNVYNVNYIEEGVQKYITNINNKWNQEDNTSLSVSIIKPINTEYYFFKIIDNHLQFIKQGTADKGIYYLTSLRYTLFNFFSKIYKNIIVDFPNNRLTLVGDDNTVLQSVRIQSDFNSCCFYGKVSNANLSNLYPNNSDRLNNVQFNNYCDQEISSVLIGGTISLYLKTNTLYVLYNIVNTNSQIPVTIDIYSDKVITNNALNLSRNTNNTIFIPNGWNLNINHNNYNIEYSTPIAKYSNNIIYYGDKQLIFYPDNNTSNPIKINSPTDVQAFIVDTYKNISNYDVFFPVYSVVNNVALSNAYFMLGKFVKYNNNLNALKIKKADTDNFNDDKGSIYLFNGNRNPKEQFDDFFSYIDLMTGLPSIRINGKYFIDCFSYNTPILFFKKDNTKEIIAEYPNHVFKFKSTTLGAYFLYSNNDSIFVVYDSTFNKTAKRVKFCNTVNNDFYKNNVVNFSDSVYQCGTLGNANFSSYFNIFFPPGSYTSNNLNILSSTDYFYIYNIYSIGYGIGRLVSPNIQTYFYLIGFDLNLLNDDLVFSNAYKSISLNGNVISINGLQITKDVDNSKELFFMPKLVNTSNNFITSTQNIGNYTLTLTSNTNTFIQAHAKDGNLIHFFVEGLTNKQTIFDFPKTSNVFFEQGKITINSTDIYDNNNSSIEYLTGNNIINGLNIKLNSNIIAKINGDYTTIYLANSNGQYHTLRKTTLYKFNNSYLSYNNLIIPNDLESQYQRIMNQTGSILNESMKSMILFPIETTTSAYSYKNITKLTVAPNLEFLINDVSKPIIITKYYRLDIDSYTSTINEIKIDTTSLTVNGILININSNIYQNAIYFYKNGGVFDSSTTYRKSVSDTNTSWNGCCYYLINGGSDLYIPHLDITIISYSNRKIIIGEKSVTVNDIVFDEKFKGYTIDYNASKFSNNLYFYSDGLVAWRRQDNDLLLILQGRINPITLSSFFNNDGTVSSHYTSYKTYFSVNYSYIVTNNRTYNIMDEKSTNLQLENFTYYPNTTGTTQKIKIDDGYYIYSDQSFITNKNETDLRLIFNNKPTVLIPNWSSVYDSKLSFTSLCSLIINQTTQNTSSYAQNIFIPNANVTILPNSTLTDKSLKCYDPSNPLFLGLFYCISSSYGSVKALLFKNFRVYSWESNDIGAIESSLYNCSFTNKNTGVVYKIDEEINTNITNAIKNFMNNNLLIVVYLNATTPSFTNFTSTSLPTGGNFFCGVVNGQDLIMLPKNLRYKNFFTTSTTPTVNSSLYSTLGSLVPPNISINGASFTTSTITSNFIEDCILINDTYNNIKTTNLALYSIFSKYCLVSFFISSVIKKLYIMNPNNITIKTSKTLNINYSSTDFKIYADQDSILNSSVKTTDALMFLYYEDYKNYITLPDQYGSYSFNIIVYDTTDTTSMGQLFVCSNISAGVCDLLCVKSNITITSSALNKIKTDNLTLKVLSNKVSIVDVNNNLVFFGVSGSKISYDSTNGFSGTFFPSYPNLIGKISGNDLVLTYTGKTNQIILKDFFLNDISKYIVTSAQSLDANNFSMILNGMTISLNNSIFFLNTSTTLGVPSSTQYKDLRINTYQDFVLNEHDLLLEIKPKSYSVPDLLLNFYQGNTIYQNNILTINSNNISFCGVNDAGLAKSIFLPAGAYTCMNLSTTNNHKVSFWVTPSTSNTSSNLYKFGKLKTTSLTTGAINNIELSYFFTNPEKYLLISLTDTTFQIGNFSTLTSGIGIGIPNPTSVSSYSLSDSASGPLLFSSNIFYEYFSDSGILTLRISGLNDLQQITATSGTYIIAQESLTTPAGVIITNNERIYSASVDPVTVVQVNNIYFDETTKTLINPPHFDCTIGTKFFKLMNFSNNSYYSGWHIPTIMTTKVSSLYSFDNQTTYLNNYHNFYYVPKMNADFNYTIGSFKFKVNNLEMLIYDTTASYYIIYIPTLMNKGMKIQSTINNNNIYFQSSGITLGDVKFNYVDVNGYQFWSNGQSLTMNSKNITVTDTNTNWLGTVFKQSGNDLIIVHNNLTLKNFFSSNYTLTVKQNSVIVGSITYSTKNNFTIDVSQNVFLYYTTPVIANYYLSGKDLTAILGTGLDSVTFKDFYTDTNRTTVDSFYSNGIDKKLSYDILNKTLTVNGVTYSFKDASSNLLPLEYLTFFKNTGTITVDTINSVDIKITTDTNVIMYKNGTNVIFFTKLLNQGIKFTNWSEIYNNKIVINETNKTFTFDGIIYTYTQVPTAKFIPNSNNNTNIACGSYNQNLKVYDTTVTNFPGIMYLTDSQSISFMGITIDDFGLKQYNLISVGSKKIQLEGVEFTIAANEIFNIFKNNSHKYFYNYCYQNGNTSDACIFKYKISGNDLILNIQGQNGTLTLRDFIKNSIVNTHYVNGTMKITIGDSVLSNNDCIININNINYKLYTSTGSLKPRSNILETNIQYRPPACTYVDTIKSNTLPILAYDNFILAIYSQSVFLNLEIFNPQASTSVLIDILSSYVSFDNVQYDNTFVNNDTYNIVCNSVNSVVLDPILPNITVYDADSTFQYEVMKYNINTSLLCFKLGITITDSALNYMKSKNYGLFFNKNGVDIKDSGNNIILSAPKNSVIKSVINNTTSEESLFISYRDGLDLLVKHEVACVNPLRLMNYYTSTSATTVNTTNYGDGNIIFSYDSNRIPLVRINGNSWSLVDSYFTNTKTFDNLTYCPSSVTAPVISGVVFTNSANFFFEIYQDSGYSKILKIFNVSGYTPVCIYGFDQLVKYSTTAYNVIGNTTSNDTNVKINANSVQFISTGIGTVTFFRTSIADCDGIGMAYNGGVSTVTHKIYYNPAKQFLYKGEHTSSGLSVNIIKKENLGLSTTPICLMNYFKNVQASLAYTRSFYLLQDLSQSSLITVGCYDRIKIINSSNTIVKSMMIIQTSGYLYNPQNFIIALDPTTTSLPASPTSSAAAINLSSYVSGIPSQPLIYNYGDQSSNLILSISENDYPCIFTSFWSNPTSSTSVTSSYGSGSTGIVFDMTAKTLKINGVNIVGNMYDYNAPSTLLSSGKIGDLIYIPANTDYFIKNVNGTATSSIWLKANEGMILKTFRDTAFLLYTVTSINKGLMILRPYNYQNDNFYNVNLNSGWSRINTYQINNNIKIIFEPVAHLSINITGTSLQIGTYIYTDLATTDANKIFKCNTYSYSEVSTIFPVDSYANGNITYHNSGKTSTSTYNLSSSNTSSSDKLCGIGMLGGSSYTWICFNGFYYRDSGILNYYGTLRTDIAECFDIVPSSYQCTASNSLIGITASIRSDKVMPFLNFYNGSNHTYWNLFINSSTTPVISRYLDGSSNTSSNFSSFTLNKLNVYFPTVSGSNERMLWKTSDATAHPLGSLLTAPWYCYCRIGNDLHLFLNSSGYIYYPIIIYNYYASGSYISSTNITLTSSKFQNFSLANCSIYTNIFLPRTTQNLMTINFCQDTSYISYKAEILIKAKKNYFWFEESCGESPIFDNVYFVSSPTPPSDKRAALKIYEYYWVLDYNYYTSDYTDTRNTQTILYFWDLQSLRSNIHSNIRFAKPGESICGILTIDSNIFGSGLFYLEIPYSDIAFLKANNHVSIETNKPLYRISKILEPTEKILNALFYSNIYYDTGTTNYYSKYWRDPYSFELYYTSSGVITINCTNRNYTNKLLLTENFVIKDLRIDQSLYGNRPNNGFITDNQNIGVTQDSNKNYVGFLRHPCEWLVISPCTQRDRYIEPYWRTCHFRILYSSKGTSYMKAESLCHYTSWPMSARELLDCYYEGIGTSCSLKYDNNEQYSYLEPCFSENSMIA